MQVVVDGGPLVLLAALVVLPLGAFLLLRVAALAADSVRGKPGNAKRVLRMGKTMSHRGGRDTTPENTMAAFENSARLVDSIELDVWLTRDNKVVILHDGKLERMCQWEGHVNDVNYMDLPAVVKTPSEGYLQGARNPNVPNKVRIPLLSDLLELVCRPENKHVTLLIEFKQHSEILAQSVLALLSEHELLQQNRVAWFSLKSGINSMLGRVGPEVPRGPSVLGIAMYAVMFRLGLLPLCRVPLDAFAITCGTVDSLSDFMTKIPIVKSLPVQFKLLLAGWYVGLLGDPQLFAAMKERGLECWVLGVNSDEDLLFAQRMGAECVITDRPEWLAAKLHPERMAAPSS